MQFSRSSGVLLHPTSLPGKYGIGELGPAAYEWIDFLVETGCGLWQVLPLGPTGYADSPYQCFSAFAGNPYLISIDILLKDGFLERSDLVDMPEFDPGKIDYGLIYVWKLKMLDLAYDRFIGGGFPYHEKELQEFIGEKSAWLLDFCLFMALKDAHGGAPWNEWPANLRKRDPQVLGKARKVHADAIGKHAFRQYLFFRQWADVKAYANRNEIQIVGDIPIFLAYDSADVWANPELFFLDGAGNPTVVAGVPPDYFSETGQLWGNPLYKWAYHAETGYAWWVERFKGILNLVDIIRLDHFRGFAGYWEIPAGEETAINGRWMKGPGAAFFDAMKGALGELPILAEDLGEITPDVVELRDQFNLPGMKIMVFAFSEADNGFLPHTYVDRNWVVYTGTHDNDTTKGWYDRVSDVEKDFARRYLARDGSDINWDLIRLAWGSVAVYAFTTVQDLLGLGNEARMNYPSTPSGNWSWRYQDGDLDQYVRGRLIEMNQLYGRYVDPHDEVELTL